MRFVDLLVKLGSSGLTIATLLIGVFVGFVVGLSSSKDYREDLMYCEKNSGAQWDAGFKAGYSSVTTPCCTFDRDSVDALKYYSKHKDGGIALTVLKKYKIK